MNILLAHNNFPGQFHRLAVELAADPANKVLFLSHYRRKDLNVPKVEWRQVPLPAEENTPSSPRKKYLTLLAQGERFADAMVALRKEGYRPDLIYGHVGFGCCIYAPDIFPDAAHAGFFEWYYSADADTRFFAGNKPVALNTRAENRQSNMCTLSALKECVLGIAPTEWQRIQHPPEFLHKIHTLHDGIDTQFFSPQANKTPLKLKSLDLSRLRKSSPTPRAGWSPTAAFPPSTAACPRCWRPGPRPMWSLWPTTARPTAASVRTAKPGRTCCARKCT